MSIEEPLMEDAVRETGLSDWGDHESFRAGLRVLLASLDESVIPAEAQTTLRATWGQHLQRRLRLINHRKNHPEIAEERIHGPLAVIGLPRTGTSVLADILALDPASRAPRQWETPLPFPPPTRTGWADDPRIEQSRATIAAWRAAFPEVAAQHAMGPMHPEECNSITTIDFWSPNFWSQHTLPRYENWLAGSRIENPYRTHRWILQHLQHHGPGGRWTLKSPFHQWDLPGLLAEYPAAMLVHTHRDPVAITASNASLVAAVRGLPRDHPERAVIGQTNVALWSAGIRRGLASRNDPAVNARIYDMSNRELSEDPTGSVQRLYQHFDLPFSEEFSLRLKQWTDQPSQPPAGKKYSLEEHGLTATDVESAYADYRTRFADYL